MIEITDESGTILKIDDQGEYTIDGKSEKRTNATNRKSRNLMIADCVERMRLGKVFVDDLEIRYGIDDGKLAGFWRGGLRLHSAIAFITGCLRLSEVKP